MKRYLSYLGFALVVGLGSYSLSTAAHKHSVPPPARVHFSGNLEGELEPCGWHVKKGGLARRASYLKQTRVDSVANLLVDAGNFAPTAKTSADSIKVRALLDFYRTQGYDAITLATREMLLGLAPWVKAEKEKTPIVVANLFAGKHGKKPLFTPYVIKQDHDHKLGVIGFVSETAWKARQETTFEAYLQPPLAMGKLIKKVARKTDHLTVLGDFTPADCDSLAKHFPEIDLIVTSGVKSAERARTAGRTVIIGAPSKGYFANYVDFNFDPADTLRFRPVAQNLDESVPVDSSVLNFVTHVNETIKSATPQH